MTDTNAAPAADDGGAIPADLLADDKGNPPPQTTSEDDGFARRLGWRPKEEFRGPQDKWLPADAFVEKVQTEVPVLRERLRTQDAIQQRMESELRETKRLAKEQGEALKELLDRTRGAEDRGWEYTRASVKAEMRKAAAEADLNRYAHLEQELEHLEANKPARKPAQPQTDDPVRTPNGADAPPDPAVAAWVRDNAWFTLDRKLHREAAAIELNILEDEPHLSTPDRLAKVSEEVARRHPEKFPNAARARTSAVSAPSGQSARPMKPKTKTVADLPQDAKLALARIKGRDPSFTDEDYMKHYQWDK